MEDQGESKTGALSGYRVLELGRVLAAPWCGQMLADLGAEVIKIERPNTGDMSRIYGPDMIIDKNGKKTGESSFYLCANRNKQSVTLDISTPEGQKIARGLALKCDVMIENFIGDTMKRYGLDYDSIFAANPGIVYCSITGYGHDGPYADRPGFDAVFQAQSGMMSVTGLPDGVPGGGPMKTGPSLIDIITGTNSALGIVAALNHRDRVSGKGQYLDMALLDSAFSCQSHVIANYLLTGITPMRRGTVGNGGGPAQVFSCSDGYIYISCGSDKSWGDLCEILGRTDLRDDERFSTLSTRWINNAKMSAILCEIIEAWKRDDLLEECVANSIPAAPVNDYDDAFSDPQVLHRGLRIPMEHPLAPDGFVDTIRSPISLSATPVDTYRRPPLLGEHTEEVLGGILGYDDADLASLRKAGIV